MNTMTRMSATFDVFQAGQSPWLDSISRELISSGKLAEMIRDKHLKGVTSNPSIFEKAIGQPGGGYDGDAAKLFRKGAPVLEVYDALTLSDIQKTCDLFLPVFKETKGEHGFVSLEVMPNLAYDYEQTLSEARRLFKAVNRPNVMIKIPATPEGIRAVRVLISEGININITLMFSMKHYQDVAHAYIEGLADRAKNGGNVNSVYSVASVFVSRIDTLIDKELDKMAAAEQDAAKREAIHELKGRAAVANSKLIYQEFKRIFASDKFKKLQKAGAHVQKPLWASTSVKNPAYSDLLYVENLVGADTVNTLPQNTLDALLDHGIIRRNTVEENLEQAHEAQAGLVQAGIDLNQVGEQLQKEGVKLFIDAFDSLMKTLENKRQQIVPKRKAPGASLSVSSQDLQARAERAAEGLAKQNFLNRFLNKDASLWKNDAAHKAVIDNRLGWLRAHQWISGKLYEIDLLKQQISSEKIKDIVLLGMGGSSLAPEVMSLICSRPGKNPRFHVLDTTDPSNLDKINRGINPKTAVFIVASKSGSTIETMSQYKFFYDKVQKSYGKKAALSSVGRHFIAITDSGSSLEKLAAEKAFRKIVINPSDIGGRYSAVSFFGLLPAALIGVDIRPLLASAAECYRSLESEGRLIQNTSIALGIYMAECAKSGRDKLTLLSSTSLRSFGAWLEQLVAESTGKEGKGVIPVDTEPSLPIEAYGDDRSFVVLKLKGESDAALAARVRALKKAGFPVLEMEWASRDSIGGEFLRWEIATAVASVLLGINPFDEPNVRESKEMTGAILAEFSKTKKLADPAETQKAASADISALLGKIKKGSYFALLAYTERSAEYQRLFDRIRTALSLKTKMPVLLGFGPRYLHSIGQLYKGGPKTGLFIAFWPQEVRDLKVPGEIYTFGQLKKAQALGDMQAIRSKGIPVLPVNLGKDPKAALKQFEQQIKKSLNR